MSKPAVLGSFFLFSCACAAALGACATDNGDAVHGPQYGPAPERDGGRDGGGGGEPEDGGPDPRDGASPADTGTDAPAEAGPNPSCTAGTAVVLAGNDTTLTAAATIAGKPWAGSVVAASAALSRPAIVPFGAADFVALTRGPANALQSVSFVGSTAAWGVVSAVGAATTIGAPSLTVVGTKAQAVYLSPQFFFFRAENSGASWNETASPVSAGAVQSFGGAAGAVQGAGTSLLFAQTGADNDGLYVQTLDGTTWSAGAPVLGAGTFRTVAPAMVDATGTYDAVLLYADNTPNHQIGYVAHTAATKAWGNAAITQATAQTSESPQVARVSASNLVVTFRGNDGRPYFMTGTLGAASITWSVPAAMLADSATVDAAPAVAKGICGDDALAVFASGGTVKATRLRGTTWSAPEVVTGAAGTRVAVSTR